MAKKKKTSVKKEKHRLKWNWPAFLLGPLWYFMHGLWHQALIMLVVMFMSGFVLVLPIAIYCGLRFEEDNHEHLEKKAKPRTRASTVQGGPKG